MYQEGLAMYVSGEGDDRVKAAAFSGDELEELRIVRGDFLERLRGVVVKVRSRVPDSTQLRDLECVRVLKRRVTGREVTVH